MGNLVELDPYLNKATWLDRWQKPLGWAAAALTVLGLGAAAAELTEADKSTLPQASGTVLCPAGKNVVGVWIHSNFLGESGWATWIPAEGQPEKAHFAYPLPEGREYDASVGCGGTPDTWETSNYSHTAVSGEPAEIVCSEIPPRRSPNDLPPTNCKVE